MDVTAVILAAGHGKRMRSQLPKVLHPLAGVPMIHYCIDAALTASNQQPVVVVGVGADQVRAEVGERARTVVQTEQLGTAHALATARQALQDFNGLVLMTTADMPLLKGETLRRLVDVQRENPGPMTMLTVTLDDPHGFGRVVRGPDGSVLAVVEEAVATPEQLAIHELNASVYCFRSDWLWGALAQIKRSPKGEYYATDLPEIAVRDGLTVRAIGTDDPDEAIGINTRVYLAEAEVVLQRRLTNHWMEAGVTIEDPRTAYLGPYVQIDAEAVLRPNVVLRGRTTIGSHCVIGPNSILTDATVGDGSAILASVIEGIELPAGSNVGPFAHLRSESTNEVPSPHLVRNSGER